MKIEIGKEFPKYFKSSYPEEFELFSHFETTSAIPQSFICYYYLERKWKNLSVFSLLELFSWR